MAQSGERRRIRANLEAIRLLATLRDEERPATAEEQHVLARWSGWGAVPGVFDKDELAAERAELMELLSPQEYQAARTNTLNAHYTDAALVQAIWQGMHDLGFAGGNVLEPGCGSGNFVGFAPDGDDEVAPTRMIGIEVDPVSAGIAAHLYPDAQILSESFAETIAPQGCFEAAVGNVPFGNYQLYDPRWNPSQESIHNHFIAKSLDLVKPGGVVAVITSHWTLDSQDPEVRRDLAAKADLLGAVRLPRLAHSSAAGTKVVTDVLVLRRREPAEEITPDPDADEEEGEETEVESRAPGWDAVRDLTHPETGTVKVNEYFAAHPERVLGTLSVRMGQFGPEVEVTGAAGEELGGQLREAFGQIAQEAHASGQAMVPPEADWQPLQLAGAATARFEGLMKVDDDDRLTQVVDGIEVEIDPPVKKSAPELFALLRLRDAYLALVEAERTRPLGDEHIEELRSDLNARYGAYVERYGPINRWTYKSNGQRNTPRLGGLRQDLMFDRVMALESFDPETQTATPAEIFHRRTIAPPEIPQSAETASDALAISLDVYNEVRLEEIQRLLGADTAEQARAALGTLVYDEPLTDRLVPAAEYLSGDVRAKLRAAQAAAEADERFAPNVEALGEVIPEDLTPEEIEARLGAAWIDGHYVEQFAREILDDGDVTVEHPGGSQWFVRGGRLNSVLASQTWGTPDVPAQALLQSVLCNKSIKVTRVVRYEDGSTRTVLDAQATEEAQGKAVDLQERFAEWVWEDPERARDLARIYNDRHNNLALRTYTGEHLSLPGLNTEFKPFAHQRAAVERVLTEPATLLAHGVGAGKTAEMAMSIMEMRRLGQARKPAMVVPNHMLEQVTREFAELYPQAKILVADKDKMSRSYRRRFADMAASGDWDVVVFGHNQFKNLPLSNRARQAYEDQQIADYEEWIANASADPNVHEKTVKELERSKLRLQNRYKKLAKAVDAGGPTLEDCGIDGVVGDEGHEYLNALVMSNIQDAAKADPSWMAEDLMMKCDYIRSTGGKVVLATATPIRNGVAQQYVITRFLRPDLLHAAGIHDFDEWASTFGEVVTETEMTPEGSYRQKDRFARFTNVPELLRMFHTFADVKLASDLELDRPSIVRPDANDGQLLEGRETEAVEPSEELLAFMKQLGTRAELARSGDPTEIWSKAQKDWRPDNMLWISSDGRFAATDLRLVDMPAAEYTKIMRVAERVHQIWDAHKDDVYYDDDGEAEPRTGSVQLVFCDLGTPSNDPTKYDAYADLREQLVAQGVPREQIRFIHEASNDKAKGELFASCRDGRTQVIIGSTTKMGTGTNIQRRAVAEHHVDCPWRPVDIEQREGRVVRQGNANDQVRILSYVTERSFDAFMWQTALRKAKFIDQIMRGTLDVREIEDVSATTMSYAEVQAIASGNPLMLEQHQNDAAVKKLRRLQRGHQQTQKMLRSTITEGREEIDRAQRAVEVYDAALQRRTDTRGDAFVMEVNGQRYAKRAQAATALRTLIADQIERTRGTPMLASSGHRFSVGQLGGFALSAELRRTGNGHTQTAIYFDDLPINNVRIGQYAIQPTLAYTYSTITDVTSSTGHGVVMSLESTLRGLEQKKEEAEQAIPRIHAEIERAENNLGQPFSRQDELDAALAERERIRIAMGLTAQTQQEDVEVPADGAGEALVQEDDLAPASMAAQPATEFTGPAQSQGSRPLGQWRNDPTPDDAPSTIPTGESPTVDKEPDAKGPPHQPDNQQNISRPEGEAQQAPTQEDRASTVEPSAAPQQEQDQTRDPQPVDEGPPPVADQASPSTPDADPAGAPAGSTPSLSVEQPPSGEAATEGSQQEQRVLQSRPADIEQRALAIIAEFSSAAEERSASDEQLRERLTDALEQLARQERYATIAELVERANRVDPDHIITREHYRSLGLYRTSAAQLQAVAERAVRIDDAHYLSYVGVVRNLDSASDPDLHGVLTANGFRIHPITGDAWLMRDDPQVRQQAWTAVMHHLERTGQARITEGQWLTVVGEAQQQAPHTVPTEQEPDPRADDAVIIALDRLTQLSLPEEQRRAIPSSLGESTPLRVWLEDQLATELVQLRDLGEHTAALKLIEQAIEEHPGSALRWASLRSQCAYPSAEARAGAVERNVLRVDRVPGDTIIRNVPRDDAVLCELLEQHRFVLTFSGPWGQAHLDDVAKDIPIIATSWLLTACTAMGQEWITEGSWQQAVSEQTPQSETTPAAQRTEQQQPVQELSPAGQESQEATAGSTGDDQEPDVPAVAPEEDESTHEAHDDPAPRAWASLRRLQSTFDPGAQRRERQTVEDSIEYLIASDQRDAALAVLTEANRVDPQQAWQREAHRDVLVWDGDEAQQRALRDPVIRVEHDGKHNTVVRGTDKEDLEVRALLRDLKFQWSRRQQFWYLQTRLNAPEQRRRVAQLLVGLDGLGRERITESRWQQIQQAAAEQQRRAGEDAIEQLRPSVEQALQQYRQEGRYREALHLIDETHRRLREDGHLRLGDVPGTGDRFPWDQQRQELMGEARERAKDLITRYRALTDTDSADLPTLQAAMTLYEELELTVPATDISDARLVSTRAGLQARIDQATAHAEQPSTDETQQEEDRSPDRDADAAEEEGTASVEEKPAEKPPSTSHETSAQDMQQEPVIAETSDHPAAEQAEADTSSSLAAAEEETEDTGTSADQEPPEAPSSASNAAAAATPETGERDGTDQDPQTSPGLPEQEPGERTDAEQQEPSPPVDGGTTATRRPTQAPVPPQRDASDIERERLISIHRDAMAWYRQQLLDEAGQSARTYLEQRGLAHVLSEESPWQVGYAPDQPYALSAHLGQLGYSTDEMVAAGLVISDNGRLFERFRHRVMVPIHNHQGEPVAFMGRQVPGGRSQSNKYINSPETAIYTKGDVVMGLGEQREALAKGARPVLVEGPLDLLAIAGTQQGTDRPQLAPLATGGTAVTDRQLAALQEVAAPDMGMVVAFDEDDEGQKAVSRLYDRLRDYPGAVNAAALPAGCDPGDLAGDPDRLGAVVNEREQTVLDVAIRARVTAHRHPQESGELGLDTAGVWAAIRDVAELIDLSRPDAGTEARQAVIRLAAETGLTQRQVSQVVTSILFPQEDIAAPAQEEIAAELAQQTETGPEVEDAAAESDDRPSAGRVVETIPAEFMPPPPRSSIDIADAQPYANRQAAERATWWLDQRGIAPWEQTATFAEMNAPRSLPNDDVIALIKATDDARQSPLEKGPRTAAEHFADLSGAAQTVAERIDDDQQHLVQMTALAHEHAARLHATEQVHQAVRNGANAAERIRIEQEQDAPPYTSREEAQETSRNIQLVAARWARTATSHQMRTSYAEHDDVRQLRALWSQIARNDLDDGPRPAAARYDGLARAVGELAQRLQSDTAALQQVAEFSRRHSGRLAATEHARAQAASPEPTRHIDSSPAPHLRHRSPAFTTGAER